MQPTCSTIRRSQIGTRCGVAQASPTRSSSLARTFRPHGKTYLDVALNATNVLNHPAFTNWNTVWSGASLANAQQFARPYLSSTWKNLSRCCFECNQRAQPSGVHKLEHGVEWRKPRQRAAVRSPVPFVHMEKPISMLL